MDISAEKIAFLGQDPMRVKMINKKFLEKYQILVIDTIIILNRPIRY